MTSEARSIRSRRNRASGLSLCYVCQPGAMGPSWPPGIELWELPTTEEGGAAEVSVGEAEATRHPELAATVAAVAGWLVAPEFDGATVVLFDGRHAEDLAGFDWPEYRVRGDWFPSLKSPCQSGL